MLRKFISISLIQFTTKVPENSPLYIADIISEVEPQFSTEKHGIYPGYKG